MKEKVLQRRALELRQHPEFVLYLFALRPPEIAQIAGISRLSRDDARQLIGYQRQEVRQHVHAIREYLDQGQVLFPNALILAFNAPILFRKSRGPSIDDGIAASGTLEIPLPPDGEERPAWIVDGQQRALALAETRNRELAVPVAAFVGANIDVQRDQFLRINSARPLALSLVTELLPKVDTFLPRRMATRRLPAAITDLLNRHPESPFRDLIRRPSTPTDERKDAVVTDTSVVEMVSARIVDTSGCLFAYRNVATDEIDSETVVRLLITYWNAVRSTFPDAWGLPPSRSRLMHGAGLRAMGHLMDTILPRCDPNSTDLESAFSTELARIAPICRWTAGDWEGLGLPWNAIENTHQKVRLLSNHLVREYTRAVYHR